MIIAAVSLAADRLHPFGGHDDSSVLLIRSNTEISKSGA